MFSAFIHVRSWISAGAIVSSLIIGMASPYAVMARESDTVVIGMGVSPTGLDPTIAAPVSIGQVVWQNIFEGLVTIDRDGRVLPQLAKSWSLSDDGLTYEFELHSGVKFHDGENFNAMSAKFTLDRARGEQSTNPQKRFFAAITSVEAPSETKLVVHLSERNGSFLYQLAWPSSVMVSEHSSENNKTIPIGTGPYRFVKWTKGYQVDLQRNKNYWDQGAMPHISNVTFRFVSDAQAQAAALKAGDIDAFPEFGAPEMMAEFEGDPRLGVFIGDTELKVVAGLNNARKPFDDKRVRQALMMAVDRNTLIEGAWSGYGTPIGSHFTANNAYFRDMTGALPYDVERAKALLAEAGFPDGFSMTIKAPQMSYAQRSALMLQAMFADIGVTLNIETSEFPAQWISDVFTNSNFDMTIVAHAEPMDIDIYARRPYYFNYENEAFRTTIKDIALTSDEKERTVLYGQAQEILAEDVPALFLFVMPKLGVWDKKLEGLWVNEPIPSNVLRDVRWVD